MSKFLILNGKMFSDEDEDVPTTVVHEGKFLKLQYGGTEVLINPEHNYYDLSDGDYMTVEKYGPNLILTMNFRYPRVGVVKNFRTNATFVEAELLDDECYPLYIRDGTLFYKSLDDYIASNIDRNPPFSGLLPYTYWLADVHRSLYPSSVNYDVGEYDISKAGFLEGTLLIIFYQCRSDETEEWDVQEVYPARNKNLDRFVAVDDKQHVYYQDQIWDKILALAPRYTKREVLDYIHNRDSKHQILSKTYDHSITKLHETQIVKLHPGTRQIMMIFMCVLRNYKIHLGLQLPKPILLMILNWSF